MQNKNDRILLKQKLSWNIQVSMASAQICIYIFLLARIYLSQNLKITRKKRETIRSKAVKTPKIFFLLLALGFRFFEQSFWHLAFSSQISLAFSLTFQLLAHFQTLFQRTEKGDHVISGYKHYINSLLLLSTYELYMNHAKLMNTSSRYYNTSIS